MRRKSSELLWSSSSDDEEKFEDLSQHTEDGRPERTWVLHHGWAPESIWEPPVGVGVGSERQIDEKDKK